MPEEIFVGHDCSKEAKFSTRIAKKTGKVTEIHYSLKLQQNKFRAMPGALILLKLLHVHTLCDDVCYNWKIVRGAGRLDEEHGPEVGYRASDSNAECKNSAVIEVYMQNKKLDTAYISINQYKKKERAYVRELPGYYTFHYDPTRLVVSPLKAIIAAKKGDLIFCRGNYTCEGEFLYRMIYSRTHFKAFDTWIMEDRIKIHNESMDKVWDVRTKEMKEEVCCPLEILVAEHNETLESI